MNYPTHLTCPYCPAQAFLKNEKWNGMMLYVCPAKHRFFAEEDKSHETSTAE